jgi:hypothetical protein
MDWINLTHIEIDGRGEGRGYCEDEYWFLGV